MTIGEGAMAVHSSARVGAATPFPPGEYLTDGTALFAVVGELPQAPTLRLLEHCTTLSVMIVSVEDLRLAGMRPVSRAGNAVVEETAPDRVVVHA
jgi:hypothetical protein